MSKFRMKTVGIENVFYANQARIHQATDRKIIWLGVKGPDSEYIGRISTSKDIRKLRDMCDEILSVRGVRA